MSSAYGQLKVIHHPEQLNALRNGVPAPPVHLQLIISDLCNQNCSFCSYRMGDDYTNGELFTIGAKLAKTGTNNPIRMMSTEKCFEILDDCAEMGVKAVEISGGGEPSVHPDHAGIYSKVLDNGMELALITNGLVLRPAALEALSRATWVRVSVDAGTPEVYSRVRRVPEEQFKTVWKNVKTIASECPSTEVGLGFVVTLENYETVGQFIKMSHDAGVSNVRLSAFFQKDGASYYQGHYEAIQDTIGNAKVLCTREDFTVYDNFGERVSDLVVGYPDYQHCGFQYFTTYIGADLNLYRCCNLSYAKNGVVANLASKRFKEAWEESHASRKGFDPSKNCPRCRFNKINQNIAYITEKSPKHVNFT